MARPGRHVPRPRDGRALLGPSGLDARRAGLPRARRRGGGAPPEQPTAEDAAVERFLRAAEPPGHDEWRSTPALRQAYKPGWAKSLDRLHRSITEELAALLAPRVSQGERGPDRLRKRFPIGPRGSAGGGPSAFRFSSLSASFDGERWHFSGTVEPVRKRQPWRAAVELRELGDEGTPLEGIPIETFELLEPSGLISLEGGIARMRAPADSQSLSFTGRSVSLAARREQPGELSFEVAGSLESA